MECDEWELGGECMCTGGGGGCIVRDVSRKMHCEEEEGVCEERRVYMIFSLPSLPAGYLS